jgi:hypothetical protein
MKVQDGLLFPRLDPVIARDLAVVLVGQAIPASPGVELPSRYTQPGNEGFDRYLGLLGPFGDEVDDRVSGVMGNPAAV